MTLIKVKHPIFAPGKSREVTGGTPAAAIPKPQRPSRGDHGVPKAGRDRARLTCLESSSLQPVPSHRSPLCLHRPAGAALYGARPGAAPGPPGPPGPPLGAAGSPQPCCPLLLAAALGRACPCPLLPWGHCGAATPAPRVLQLWGYHPAALLGVLGAVLGVFQLWAPPALTAPRGDSLSCASPG